MLGVIYKYPLIIQETDLDSFGHVNNAIYLTLYEEARWDLITKNGYGLQKIKQTGVGPILLDVKMSFLKELKARDEIVIESQSVSYKNKIGKLHQKMLREGIVCSTAEFTIALFDMQERKIIPPTEEWLKAIGWNNIPLA